MRDSHRFRHTVPGGEALFGRLVAGSTHELTNVLNIIGELAGLQDDILRDAAAGDAPDSGRLAELAGRIHSQTDRGQELLRQLNRFAHSVDRSGEAYDVCDMLECLVALTERFARLTRTQLELRPPLEEMTLVGDPFAMLVAVSACLDAALGASNAARRIRLLAERASGAVRITVESGDPIPTAPPELLEAIDAAVGPGCGRIVQTPSSTDPHRFVLELSDVRSADVMTTEDTHAP
jgi:signal transduction histidine kinase